MHAVDGYTPIKGDKAMGIILLMPSGKYKGLDLAHMVLINILSHNNNNLQNKPGKRKSVLIDSCPLRLSWYVRILPSKLYCIMIDLYLLII